MKIHTSKELRKKIYTGDTLEKNFVPVYLSKDGEIIFLSPCASLEKAWASVKHDLVQATLVIELEISKNDFFN